MNKIFKLITAVMMVAATITFSSCKKTFDNPPGAADPNIVANTTIKDLIAMHTTGGAYDMITTDIIISGVVVADDKSGNFYKQLFIQDATGGIEVLLDANSLYGTYPVGRRIFIRCNGLCISDYNNVMEIGVKAMVGGLPSIEGIPGSLISRYVVGGSLNNPVVPKLVTFADLTIPTNKGWLQPYIGTLIQLDNFAFTDLSETYSDTSAYKSTQNRDIKNCSSQTIIVRTSAYANFAALRVPQGRGSIVSIFTGYGTTKQLIIRDTSDVKFNNTYSCPLPPGTIFLEDFESIGANNGTLNVLGWKNIGEVGGVPFKNAVFGSVKCGKAEAFGSGVNTMTSWFISPAINLPAATLPKFSFTNADGYDNGATFKVYISTNYNGSNTPSTSTWTLLPAIISSGHTASYGPFISSGIISLAAYAGQTVYIGFRYDGADPSPGTKKTTTFEFDDVTIIQ